MKSKRQCLPHCQHTTIQLNRQSNEHVQKKVHIRYDNIDVGNCFTLAARSEEAKISAVFGALQSPHCS